MGWISAFHLMGGAASSLDLRLPGDLELDKARSPGLVPKLRADAKGPDLLRFQRLLLAR